MILETNEFEAISFQFNVVNLTMGLRETDLPADFLFGISKSTLFPRRMPTQELNPQHGEISFSIIFNIIMILGANINAR